MICPCLEKELPRPSGTDVMRRGVAVAVQHIDSVKGIDIGAIDTSDWFSQAQKIRARAQGWGLTDEEAQIFIWRFVHTKTFKQIGENMGMPAGTAYQTYRRALEKVRQK